MCTASLLGFGRLFLGVGLSEQLGSSLSLARPWWGSEEGRAEGGVYLPRFTLDLLYLTMSFLLPCKYLVLILTVQSVLSPMALLSSLLVS